LFDIQSITNIL